MINHLSKHAPIYLLIILAAAMRMVPHPWNIAPIGALGLFAGAYLTTRSSWLVPIVALLVGDLLIGTYSSIVMVFVYSGFAVSAVVGRTFLSQQRNTTRIGASVFGSAFIFFLLSNFGVWIAYYEHSWAGLATCYINAIPFFGRSLVGDAFYAIVLFGSYELLNQWWHSRKSTIPA